MKSKIVFLYLYGLHQLYHSAMTAMELGTIDDKNEVLCLSCNDEHTEILETIKTLYPDTNTKIIQLPAPFRYKYLNFKNKTYPSVNAMIKRAKSYLIDADLVLTTSHGTPKMLNKFGISKPKVMYQYHGVGDRKYGFDPEFKRFDFMVLPGAYHQSRLIEENIIAKDKTEIVGWPKLDYVNTLTNLSYFDNENPTFLYTPHWKKDLTSYDEYAEFILDYFTQNKQYNLIFAPHLLIKHWKTSNNYNINYDHYNSDNIRVDFGSTESTNGAYLKAADVYIGDVSSMVFEFITIENRPCIFINGKEVEWKNNVDYRFWEFGKVVESKSDFDEIIQHSIHDHSFFDLQKERTKAYIDIQEKRSCLRAAEAVNRLLKP